MILKPIADTTRHTYCGIQFRGSNNPALYMALWFICVLSLYQLCPSITYGLGLAPDDALKDPAILRSTSVTDILRQAPRVVEKATSEDKAIIRTAIDQVFVSDRDRTAKLTFVELQQLQRFYCYLVAGAGNRESLVSVWFEASTATPDLTLNQQVWLLSQFEDPASESNSVSTLKSNILSQISSSANQMTVRQIASTIRALSPQLSNGDRNSLLILLGNEWASRNSAKLPFNLTNTQEASSLRAWQDIFDDLGDGTDGSSQYTMHLPSFLSKATVADLYWRFRYEHIELIAQPIRTKESQDQLLAMAQAEESLRQDIMQVLSSAYHQTGKYDEWVQRLDTMIEDTGLSDDQRAQWMIAKSYSMSLADNNHRYVPRHSLPILHDAISLAQTDHTRVACLKRIVQIEASHFWFDRAREDLERYSGTLSEENAEAISEMEAMITMTEHITSQLHAGGYTGN